MLRGWGWGARYVSASATAFPPSHHSPRAMCVGPSDALPCVSMPSVAASRVCSDRRDVVRKPENRGSLFGKLTTHYRANVLFVTQPRRIENTLNIARIVSFSPHVDVSHLARWSVCACKRHMKFCFIDLRRCGLTSATSRQCGLISSGALPT